MAIELRAKIQINKFVPHSVEQKLCRDRGFFILKRDSNGILIGKVRPQHTFTQDDRPSSSPSGSGPAYPDSLDDLTTERIKELTRTCEKVFDFYLEPYNRLPEIARRLRNIGKTLPNLEQEWIENWVFNHCN